MSYVFGMKFLAQMHHPEAEEWLSLIKATLLVALEAHRKQRAIISFGGYLRAGGEIVLVGHPEILPPTAGITSWIEQELQRCRQDAIVTIIYADIRYKNTPALQLRLESARQEPIELIYQINPPKMIGMTAGRRAIWS